MQKLEDFLFDFIGIFIPGFFLITSSWITTTIFLDEKVYALIVNFLKSNQTMIFNGNLFFIEKIMQQKPIIYLMLIVLCYLIGHIVSSLSLKYMKFFKVETNSYNENIKIVDLVEAYLASKYKVAWDKIKPKNKWIAYYRWANIEASTKEEKSSLQILLSKTILFRSISVSFLIIALYGFILVIMNYVILFLNKLDLMNVGYIIVTLVFLLGSFGNSYYFMKVCKNNMKILCNESILIINKAK